MQLLSKLQESRLQMSLRIKSDSNCWRETRKNTLLMCSFIFEALSVPMTTRPKNVPNLLCISSHSARRASTIFLQMERLIKLCSAMLIQPTATLRYLCSRCLQSTGDGGVLQTFRASRELKSHWTSGFVLSSQRSCFSYSPEEAALPQEGGQSLLCSYFSQPTLAIGCEQEKSQSLKCSTTCLVGATLCKNSRAYIQKLRIQSTSVKSICLNKLLEKLAFSNLSSLEKAKSRQSAPWFLFAQCDKQNTLRCRLFTETMYQHQ